MIEMHTGPASISLVSRWREEARIAHSQLIKMAWEAEPDERQDLYAMTSEVNSIYMGLESMKAVMDRTAQRSLDSFGGE